MYQKVPVLIPSWGMYRRRQINVSHISVSPSPPLCLPPFLSLKSIDIFLVEDKTKLGHWTLHSLSLLANFFIITSLTFCKKQVCLAFLCFSVPSVYSLIISGCLMRICR